MSDSLTDLILSFTPEGGPYLTLETENHAAVRILQTRHSPYLKSWQELEKISAQRQS